MEFAQAASDEFHRVGESNVQADLIMDEARKPENEHPQPLPLRAFRGSVYYL